MRARDKLGEALFVAFAAWLAVFSTMFFFGFAVAWLFFTTADQSLTAFMSQYEFAAFFVVSFVTALLFAASVGLLVWWARGKSARDRGQVERLLDAWVTKLSRSDR